MGMEFFIIFFSNSLHAFFLSVVPFKLTSIYVFLCVCVLEIYNDI